MPGSAGAMLAAVKGWDQSMFMRCATQE